MQARIFEGAFAGPNPRTTTLAGAGALRAADPDGIAVGRFGWADKATGRAANERTNPEQLLGFVLPTIGGWQKVYVGLGRVYVRPGLEITMCSRGDFFARFAGGALAGQPVYASILDGSAICGQAPNAELTPWSVVTNCGPGELAIISTWSFFPP
jgi:hypothetical protein